MFGDLAAAVPDFSHPLIAWGTGRFVGFLLVFCRVAGLMTVGPVFGTPVVPPNVRVLLALAAAAVVAPALPGRSAETFRGLDGDRDGRLSGGEIPVPVLDLLAVRGEEPPPGGLTLAAFASPAPLPRTPAGLARLSLGEFSVGFALGLGVFSVLAGLRLAGELIDQQIGTALGEVFNPMLGGSASTAGQLLGLLGTAALLTLPGGRRTPAAVRHPSRHVPHAAAGGGVGVRGTRSGCWGELAGAGATLGLRVAAPTLAVMSLMSLTVGFLGRTVPQINVLSVGFPTRAAAGLLVLALTLSPAADVLSGILSASLTALHEALVGLPDPRG